MNLRTALLGFAIINFVVYFYLFQKHINSLGPEQRLAFVKRSRPGKTINLLIGVPLAGLLVMENIYIRSGAALSILVFMVIGARIQHQSLRALRFSEDFITRLRGLSYLAGLSVALIFLAVLFE